MTPTNANAIMLECRELTRVYSEGPQDLTVLDQLELTVHAGRARRDRGVVPGRARRPC